MILPTRDLSFGRKRPVTAGNAPDAAARRRCASAVSLAADGNILPYPEHVGSGRRLAVDPGEPMTDARATFRVLLMVVALIAAVLVPTAVQSDRADALSAADWDAGYIISDENFYNGSAMSEAEIQRFLETTVGTCQNSNCLAVYREDTPTRTWSFGTCSTYAGAAGESAARIIFKVQQACNLSAKVILVTLQKEQSLLTNRAPSDGIMRKAMGYGCPDTAACDSTYYGFFNQLFAAGRQLTWYGNPAGSFTSIRVGQVNAIQYHPNAGCGTKDVLVRNRATAALYYYTPYTPNAAALANLGGTGTAAAPTATATSGSSTTTCSDLRRAAADRRSGTSSSSRPAPEQCGWPAGRSTPTPPTPSPCTCTSGRAAPR